MKEFVYIPRKNSGVSPLDALASATQGNSRITLSASLAGAANVTMSQASLEDVASVAEVSSTMASSSANAMEMLGYVEQSGAVLLKANEMPVLTSESAGGFYPVVNYSPAIAGTRVGRTKVKLYSGPAAASFLQIRLQYADNATPVVGAVANLRLRGRQEVNAVSDSNGVVTFGLRASNISNARLLVEAGFAGHWGLLKSNVTIASGQTFDIERINLSIQRDSLRHMIGNGTLQDGQGVRVGVIDSGVGPHTDLPNVRGDFDSSIGHGTHVAGIVGGRGPVGLEGVAPGVEIISYRVFDDPETGTTRNFDIHRAIEQAVVDGCHIINLSLKLEYEQLPQYNDPVVSRAIEDATDAGVLCVAAAGNDFRRFVSFPARHSDVLAVSALGWEPGLGADAYDSWTISADRSAVDARVYFANFSNEGVQGTNIDITGPGAGVVSTVPGDTYAPMSGTSMACPAMVGVIAKLLSSNQGILAMAASRSRVNQILQLINVNQNSAGFSHIREGGGTLS